MPKIAVDAMGGDRAPQVVIEGAVLAARDRDDEITLVGDPPAIESELAKHKDAPKFSVVAAEQIVPMHESPSAALRIKDSSMKVGFEGFTYKTPVKTSPLASASSRIAPAASRLVGS